MRTLKVTLAYDGTNFLGWQVQPSGRTIEGEIKKALGFMHKHEVPFQGAGRTDAGVHASGQVISYQSDLDTIPLDRYARALNSFFPMDIRARAVEVVSDDFHARYDARLRVYKYYILNSDIPAPQLTAYALRVVRALDLVLLNRLAATLVGTHDFTTFSAPNDQVPNRVRTVHAASFYMEGPLLVFEIAAGSFLWKMVRSLVGSLLTFAQEEMAVAEFRRRLAAKDRSLAAPTAPAWGLFLTRVVYKDEPILF